MEDKKNNELSTPDTPKSSNGNGKSRKQKKKGGKTATDMSSTEGIKIYIFITGPAMNRTFLMSREKFLGYVP